MTRGQHDWVNTSAALTVRHGDAPPSAVAAAQIVERLGALARALVMEDEAGEALDGIPGWLAAQALAAELAGQTRGQAVTVLSGMELAWRYMEALRDAAGAVHYCRTVQHASRSCCFSIAGPRAGLCGRVLVAAHRLDLPVPA